ncbi:phage tail tape measure protein [Kingella negevensis]|uniref:phage tail tape measure protein n=1 Tax=Kingella negevensis TaxID=1522312 RepID=UPI002543222D|nr:phage tail tape measure protein [Kingella negevensis]WII93191.1 phage tail tape measure protein [Kingella negevensis]
MSEQIIKARIQISADVNGSENINRLANTIREASGETSELAQQAEKLQAKWQQAQANQALIAQYRNLKTAFADNRQEITQTEQKLTELTTQAQKLQAIAAAKTVLGLDVDEHARKEINALNQAYARLKQSGTLSHTDLARASDLHAQKVRELENALQRAKPSLMDIADSIQGVVTQASGLAYAANQAMKFETAMAGVKKVTNGTPEQYDKLTGSLKELSAELGIMPDELANMAAAGGQMGVAMEKLPEFTQMAAQMSVAFGITADRAGEMAAKTSNVFGLQLDGMRDLGDAINTLGNTTAAKEAEIAEVLLRIGGNANQFGLTAKQAAALGAAFISLGKTPEVASTAINAMLQKLQNAKLGTNDFQAALKDLGYSADDMAAQIAANPQAALDGFLAKLSELDKQTRSEKIGQLFGAEYADDVAVLVGSLDTYKTALDNATDSNQTFGAMQKETEAAMDTTAKKIDQAKANLTNAAIELGNALLPAIQATAAGVGGVAKTLGAISEQFPVLTQLAALFMGAKVAVTAYQSAMKLVGKEGAASILKTDVSVTQLRTSLINTSAAAKELALNMRHALAGNTQHISVKTGEIGKLAGALSSATQGAMALWSAWEMGHSFGTGLRESSELVRDFGDGLGKAVAYVDAMFTDRTFEDVNKFYRTTKQEAKETEEAAKKAAQAKQAQAAAQKQADDEQLARIQSLQAKRANLTVEIERNNSSLKTLNESGQAHGAIAAELAAQNEKLRGELAAMNAGLGSLNSNISDTSALSKNKQALQDLGLTAEQVQTGISKSAQTALDNFSSAAQVFGTDVESMSRIFQAAIQKMDSPEAVQKLKDGLKTVGERAGLTEQQIQNIAAAAPAVADKVAQAFDKIGVDTAAVMTGISTEAQQAMANFQAASNAAKETGVNDSRLIAAGFEQMMAKLKSPEEFAAFRQQLSDSGNAANLTQEQLERLNQAAEKGAIAATTAYDKLASSLKTAANTAQVQAAGQAAEQAMERGEISAAQYQTVLQQVSDKTEELKQKAQEQGKAAEQSHDQAAAAAQRQASAEQTASEAADETAQSTESIGAAAQSSGQQISEFGQKIIETYRNIHPLGYSFADAQMGAALMANGAWSQFVDYMWNMHDEVNRAISQLNQSMESGIGTAQALAKAEVLAANNADKLDKTTLDNLKNAIAQARQEMQALAEDAANTLQTAEKELLKLQGKTEQVEDMERKQKIAELSKKQKDAERKGNTKAAQDYQATINVTEQTYRLKAQQKAEAKAKEEAERVEAERQQREQAQAKTVKQPVSISLPEAPSVDLGNLDLSGLTSQLNRRDKDVVNQAAQQVINKLQQQLKART